MRVAVVHDYLTQRGGAERVVLSMLKCFPDATLYTTIYNPQTTYPEFRHFDVRTSRLSRYRIFREDPRRALPFLARAISRLDIDNVDVVLVSTSGWAHGVRSSAPVVAYCHTPARWLYEGTNYFRNAPRIARRLFDLCGFGLRRWDVKAAEGVSKYLANSTTVRNRIKRVYGIEAEVVHPPSALDASGPRAEVGGLAPGFFLTVGRKRGYKNTDKICEAVSRLSDVRLVVVGELPERSDAEAWPSNIVSVTGPSDDQLRWLYASSRGVVAMSHEDFGLTPVEGFSFGRPCVALAAGGYLDSCSESEAAVLVSDLEIDSIVSGLKEAAERIWDEKLILKHGQKFASAAFETTLIKMTTSILGTDDRAYTSDASAAPSSRSQAR